MSSSLPPGTKVRMDLDPRPYVRWWWFSIAIDPQDIDRQVDWLASRGFGGIEVAWLYPLPGKKPGVAYLSPEWTALCKRAREACDRNGMGCDFTFGTVWPFGGSFVEEAFSSKTWKGPSPQRLDRSWELAQGAEPGRILDHLSRVAFERYAAIMGSALAPALCKDEDLAKGRDSIFCDSWEVEMAGLWAEGYGEAFTARFGYAIEPFMEVLDEVPERRYDYRRLISEWVLREFYTPFAEKCGQLGAAARIQAHGSPTDLLSSYALADIPESETLLFDPEFSTIAASAALLSGRKTVSAEAFTCLYGWVPYPGEAPRLGEELIGDLMLTANAMLAFGVNHFVWHGMPFQGKDERNRFYASVHVGPDSGFAAELAGFNAYLARASKAMKRGRTYARVACWYPFEDSLMAGELPPELKKPSAVHYWEMQDLVLPIEAQPYGAVWINEGFLAEARPEGRGFSTREASFEALYIDAEFIERGALERMVALAEAGVAVVLKRRPREPGTHRSPEYAGLADTLAEKARANLCDYPGLVPILTPIINSATDREPASSVPASPTRPTDPPFWVRREGEVFYLFVAHPACRGLRYPLPYDHARNAPAMRLSFRLKLASIHGSCDFPIGQAGAILLRIEGDSIERIDIDR